MEHQKKKYSYEQERRNHRASLVTASVFAVLVIGAGCIFAYAGCSSSQGSAPAPAVESSANTTAGGDGTTPALNVTDVPADTSPSQGNLLDPAHTSGPNSSAIASDGQELPADLVAQIQGIGDSCGMDAGIAVIDLKTGARGGYQADDSMISASMIKLIIAEAFLQQVASGNIGLDEYYTLQSSDIVGGTGSLGGYGAGAQVTYGEMLNKMISESDNTATNIIIDRVGMDAVNAEADLLGLEGTKLNRYMMDYDAIAAGNENYVSANDVAQLLEMIYDGTFVDARCSDIMLQALEQQVDYGGIMAGLPDNVVFAHKTGTLDSVLHDGGIVEGEHPFVIVVLCGGPGFYVQGAMTTMAQVADAAYAYIAG